MRFLRRNLKHFPTCINLSSQPLIGVRFRVWTWMLTLTIPPNMGTFFPFLAYNCKWRRYYFSWVQRTSTVGWLPSASEGARRPLEPCFSLVAFSLGTGQGLDRLPRLKRQWEKAGPSSSILGGGPGANKRREACPWTCTWATLIWRAPISEVPVNRALTTV